MGFPHRPGTSDTAGRGSAASRGPRSIGPIGWPLAVAFVGATLAPAADWPTFRGTGRTAVAPDTGLLDRWPEAGPKLLWEASGAGRGYASVAIAGDRMFTLGDGLSTAGGDKDEHLSCFDRTTGRQLWKTKTGSPWNEGRPEWQGSRSTPTVDGERVYIITPHGQLVACAAGDGRELFRIDLKSQFGGHSDPWGYSESVTIDDDRLVCTPGGEQATMVALDKKTGRPIWSCPMKGATGAGHSSIVSSTVGGRKAYVQLTAAGLFAVDAETGRFLWAYPIEKTVAVIPTPIVKDDLVFFSAGYKRGGALLRQKPGPDGKVAIEEIYGLKPELANKHGGVVLVGDHLYGCADDQPIIFCAALETGEIVWKKRGSGKDSAALAVADGHLYVQYQDGTLALVKADPTEYQEVCSFKIPGSGDQPCWSHPVIVDGHLYVRDQDRILSFDLRR